jgi:mannobiose 2-epimerase
LISYGHDIEAAWLLYAAALAIEDGDWIQQTKALAIKLAVAAAEGLDKDGGLWYEKEDGHLIREKHWWPQAEAMVGFVYAWRISGDRQWLTRSMAAWDFIKNYLRDPDGNEWYWGVLADHTPMPGQDRAGFWKCPYHNSRACLEIIRALDSMAV